MTFLPQEPDIVHQAGWNIGNADEVHPFGIAALLVMSALALVLPRKWLTLPMAILICVIPDGQRIILFTLDFTFLRILLLVLWTRILLRSEFRPLSLNLLDRALLLYVLVMMVCGFLLQPSGQRFVNRLGPGFDAVFLYFFFRHSLRNFGDLMRLAKMFFGLSIPVLGFFLIEHRTQHNLFSVLGGVPEQTLVREGRLRCQGAFSHPILAGCFWALLMPLYIATGILTRKWIQPVLACAIALALVILCASSTPAMSILLGLGAASAYLVRRAIPVVRWIAVFGVIGLHMVMKAPVWSLVGRIDLAGGSTGDHRYRLIDNAIHHFDEWALFGTLSTAHWGWGMEDVANMYVGVGVDGGFATLALFVAMIVISFVGISRNVRSPQLPRNLKLASWALGCMLFMHCTNFIGVGYFGQIQVLWYLTLASIGSLCLVPGSPSLAARPAVAAAPAAWRLRSQPMAR